MATPGALGLGLWTRIYLFYLECDACVGGDHYCDRYEEGTRKDGAQVAEAGGRPVSPLKRAPSTRVLRDEAVQTEQRSNGKA